jgi:hypothetical protein
LIEEKADNKTRMERENNSGMEEMFNQGQMK